MASLSPETKKSSTLTPPPGVVVSHLSQPGKIFVGSPSLALLENGALVAVHDTFGPQSGEHECATTLVFRSEDAGETWEQVTAIKGAFWSNLFVHDGALYLMGVTHHHGLLVIRRSDDGGRTWTSPENGMCGLITPYGQYHTAPMPMVVARGRIWRAIEDATSSTEWGIRYNPLMISAPLGADLLRRDSWQFSTLLRSDKRWLKGEFGGWLEGNLVRLPDGRLADVLRVQHSTRGVAAVVTLAEDGQQLCFNPDTDFIDLPGGTTKFLIREDPQGGGYWALANAVPPAFIGSRKEQSSIRNTLALMHSSNAVDWDIRYTLLHHPDPRKHAFQYPDWIFDGDDLLVLSRTCWEDEDGDAPNHHDANFMTFHRVQAFRELTLADSATNPFA